MSSIPDTSIPSIPGLDLAAAMARMDLTWEEMKELLTFFPDAAREEVAKLRAAEPDDAATLRFSAHALAGLAGNYGANDLWAAAKALETAVREEHLADAPALLDKIETLADTVCSGVEQALRA